MARGQRWKTLMKCRPCTDRCKEYGGPCSARATAQDRKAHRGAHDMTLRGAAYRCPGKVQGHDMEADPIEVMRAAKTRTML